ncbi:ABC transporter permease [Ralstonia syzygii]|uniref:ABC transporter permease n=1 Tax=Ralstonia syzygii TaxID=28097 RepID=UPI0018D125C9|nr:ABC transporter permease [Ralstonia syzygii]
MESLAPLIAASINAGTPLLLAALGLLMNERSGVLNLGAEGMMLVAAVVGFMVGYQTQIPLLGFAAGALAGMVMATLFAWLALVLVTNQVATGLALSIFGTGLSAFMGQRFVGMSLPAQAYGIPGLKSLPFVGPALFGHHWMVYFSLLLCGAIAWFLFKTRAGLTLRAIGESPESAHALGYPVRTIRFGALLFGGVTILQFYLQGIGVSVPSQILSMAPFAATIVVLAVISRNPDWIRLNMPASLGKPFRPGSA